MAPNTSKNAAAGNVATAVAEENAPFYIVAPKAKCDHTRVLMRGDTFAVFDQYGELPGDDESDLGIFHEGTRHLSRFALQCWGGRLLLLSSRMRDDNDVLLVDCANPDVCREDRVTVERGTVHVRRSVLLWDGACRVQLKIHNYGAAPVDVPLTWRFAADFADVFEVRGMHRARKGKRLPAQIAGRSVCLRYEGLDGVERQTHISFTRSPSELDERQARFVVSVSPSGNETLEIAVDCKGTNGAGPFADAFAAAGQRASQHRGQACSLFGSHEHFNAWVDRAAADLQMMTVETAFGPYPYAGVPWFSTPFGRDGIITALERLWLDPDCARGVLAFLAATQATEVNPDQDAEPGKILHECRQGEMAALGEIPFARYYGSVDATPLFVWLAGEYWERTGDRPFIESIWPHVCAALDWMTEFGDADGDGFIEYSRRSETGLVQQGWKDSHDSIFHADGSLAGPPIALCEVQGYAYAAWQAAATLACAMDEGERADHFLRRAAGLKERFYEAFWCDDLGTYAIALDGEKRPCRVRSSNAGHCLFAGIVPEERASRVVAALFDPAAFSGWGVRTLSANQARYNPMSYHNGSVWPHDNALIAAGLARYGFKHQTLQLVRGQFEACRHLELHRLPELFCGFPRHPGEPPTLYPVACSPQAWAAAAVFLLVQACLGACVSEIERRVTFTHPVLPEFLDRLHIRNLNVGDAVLDLLLLRHDSDVGVNILRRAGTVELALIK